MRLLLDESLPWRLMRLLKEHQVTSVQRRGWAGIRNGALLELASKEFDAFVTADQNLAYQQNLARLPISVFVLAARSTALSDLAPLVPRLIGCLQSCEAGTLVRIDA